MLELGGSYGGAYLLRRGLYMPWELERVMDADMARVGFRELDPILRLNHLTSCVDEPRRKVALLELTQYMRNQLLRDTDWAGMAHSLEIRVPLVDKNVLTYLYKNSYILNTKPYLKKDLANCAYPPLLPDILSRSKTGFTVPVKAWFMKKNTDKKIQHGQRDWQNYVMANFL